MQTVEERRQYFRQRQAMRRQELVALMGGRCVRCGTTDELQFDHIDGSQRAFRLSGWAFNLGWDKILPEAAKCQLLCPPCHRRKSKENGEQGGGQNRIDMVVHGTARSYYYRRCRCGRCREAMRRYKRKEISIGQVIEGG